MEQSFKWCAASEFDLACCFQFHRGRGKEKQNILLPGATSLTSLNLFKSSASSPAAIFCKSLVT